MIPASFSYRLQRDLAAVDGTVLLRKGEVVGEGTAAAVLALRPQHGFSQVALQETAVFADFQNHLSDLKYNRLFRDIVEMSELQAIIGRLALPTTITQEFHEMEAIDAYTYRHIFLVAALTALLARRMDLNDERISQAAGSALWHDFGKTRLPLDILLSQDYLDQRQFAELKEHPLLGYLLLVYYFGQTDSLCCRTALRHHEKRDGSGYPCGIRQEDALVGLVTVADIYDALISRRSYRDEPFDIRGALDLLWDEATAGKIPELPVRLLIGLNREDQPENYEKMAVHRLKRGRVPKKNRYGRK